MVSVSKISRSDGRHVADLPLRSAPNAALCLRFVDQGKNPFQLDAREPDIAKIETFMYSVARDRGHTIHTLRYRAKALLRGAIQEPRDGQPRAKPSERSERLRASMLLEKEKTLVQRRWKEYKYLSERTFYNKYLVT